MEIWASLTVVALLALGAVAAQVTIAATRVCWPQALEKVETCLILRELTAGLAALAAEATTAAVAATVAAAATTVSATEATTLGAGASDVAFQT